MRPWPHTALKKLIPVCASKTVPLVDHQRSKKSGLRFAHFGSILVHAMAARRVALLALWALCFVAHGTAIHVDFSVTLAGHVYAQLVTRFATLEDSVLHADLRSSSAAVPSLLYVLPSSRWTSIVEDYHTVGFSDRLCHLPSTAVRRATALEHVIQLRTERHAGAAVSSLGKRIHSFSPSSTWAIHCPAGALPRAACFGHCERIRESGAVPVQFTSDCAPREPCPCSPHRWASTNTCR